MTREIRRTKQLERDIIEIYQYIYDDSPQSAERVLDATKNRYGTWSIFRVRERDGHRREENSKECA